MFRLATKRHDGVVVTDSISGCRHTLDRHFRYDAEQRGLHVTFVTGRQYVYPDVPPDVHEALKKAVSKGEFINRRIRDHYPHREIKRFA